ncbi:MAG TPA: metal-dependent hydrolase [Thermoanaerobaculia bacterium]|jgi:inner membrane protein|nr:metal-dependent hydrolase [Thermoanaerobaculia bacterium]
MPTIFTHPAVALLKTWWPRLPARVAIAGAALTIVPDLDIAAFALDIPYAHPLGHRGFSHSIVFALLIAALATWILRLREHRRSAFIFLFVCAISHGVLDALTNGGLGVAFFAPFDNTRYFFPWTPIRVSPIGAGFFSARGWETLRSELVWVWVPCVVAALFGRWKRVL